MTEQAYVGLDEAFNALKDLGLESEEVKVEDLNFSMIDDNSLGLSWKGRGLPVQRSTVAKAIEKGTGISPSALVEYKDDVKLVATMIQHSIKKRKGSSFRIVTSPEGLEAFYEADHPWISPVEALERTVSTLGEGGSSGVLGIAGIQNTRGRLSLKVITAKTQIPPTRVNDVTHSGVWIRANGGLEVSAYSYNLVCTNGMMSYYNEVVGNTHDARAASFRDLVVTARDRADDMITKTIELDKFKVENPASFLTHFSRLHNVSDRSFRQLMDGLPELPEEPTRYDMTQLITGARHRTGNDSFEWLGGTAVDSFRDHVCSHCYSPLS